MKQVHSANEDVTKDQLQNRFKPKNLIFKSLSRFLSLSSFIQAMVQILILLVYDFSQPETPA